ncbi:unnamed protein product [Echinostoma caproni]|uniref:LIM zinc-binding domain-containing protein n=1 Tax=Echinostoma caproni TaxID=27848 RepID=A0A183A659_9TREM|nr:unnamed protein product [Echinostoma caproni]
MPTENVEPKVLMLFLPPIAHKLFRSYKEIYCKISVICKCTECEDCIKRDTGEAQWASGTRDDRDGMGAYVSRLNKPKRPLLVVNESMPSVAAKKGDPVWVTHAAEGFTEALVNHSATDINGTSVKQEVPVKVNSQVLDKSSIFHGCSIVPQPVIRKKCIVCSGSLHDSDAIQPLANFHERCFHCNRCQRQLSIGDDSWLGGRPYCERHFESALKAAQNTLHVKTSSKGNSATRERTIPIQLAETKWDDNTLTIDDTGISPARPIGIVKVSTGPAFVQEQYHESTRDSSSSSLQDVTTHPLLQLEFNAWDEWLELIWSRETTPSKLHLNVLGGSHDDYSL